MVSQPPFEFPDRRSALSRAPELLSVHVLGEFVYCPRAAVLALETPNQDEEPGLGPRLDGVLDYNDHRFVEAVRVIRQRLVNLALATTGVLCGTFLFWRWFSPLMSMIWVFPLTYLLLQIFHNCKRLTLLVGAHGRLKAAADLKIDLNSAEPQAVNWWSLRKAGFKCLKPVDPNQDRVLGIVGKPWRILTKEPTERIPVIRKHLGGPTLKPQHQVRVAAYCELLKAAEGVAAPFGVVVFAGSETCWIIPNTPAARQRYELELVRLREFLTSIRRGTAYIATPDARQCGKCRQGMLRKFVASAALTDAFGRRVLPRLSPGNRHSPCGDRFNWDPPQAK